MESGDTEYAHTEDVLSALRSSVTVLNKVSPVYMKNIPAHN